jgi:hypothetical protein
VTIRQMLHALMDAIHNEPAPLKVYEIPDIRNAHLRKSELLKTTETKPSYL